MLRERSLLIPRRQKRKYVSHAGVMKESQLPLVEDDWRLRSKVKWALTCTTWQGVSENCSNLHTVYCTLCIAYCVLHTVYYSLHWQVTVVVVAVVVVVVVVGHGKRQTWWQCFNQTMLILLRSIQSLNAGRLIGMLSSSCILLYEVQQRQQLLVIPLQHVFLNQYVA